MHNKINKCKICNAENHKIVYEGDVRNGKYPNTLKSRIYKCQSCQIESLDPINKLIPSDYNSDNYRNLLKQSDPKAHEKEHKDSYNYTKKIILSNDINLTGEIILDSGAASGKILDLIGYNFKKKIAVEPSNSFKEILLKKGYEWFPSNTMAQNKYQGSVDLLISSKVIEHVDNPINYLKEIFFLLKPGGTSLITTPNRSDYLLRLVGDNYQKFFYRTQHLWYFDKNSLIHAANKAGIKNPIIKFDHFYGLKNLLNWIKLEKPSDSVNFDIFDEEIDKNLRMWLIEREISDTLVLLLKKPYN